jgi:hypothetical protein
MFGETDCNRDLNPFVIGGNSPKTKTKKTPDIAVRNLANRGYSC